jgi:hypothetical protein
MLPNKLLTKKYVYCISLRSITFYYIYYYYYFNNIGLQVSPTYKSQRRRFSLINTYYIPCSILIHFQFFLQFCTMRKIAQFGKYIRSLAIPPWTSFTVCVCVCIYIYIICGARCNIVFKALGYKPKGRGFEIRGSEILNLPNPSGRTRPWSLFSL